MTTDDRGVSGVACNCPQTIADWPKPGEERPCPVHGAWEILEGAPERSGVAPWLELGRELVTITRAELDAYVDVFTAARSICDTVDVRGFLHQDHAQGRRLYAAVSRLEHGHD